MDLLFLFIFLFVISIFSIKDGLQSDSLKEKNRIEAIRNNHDWYIDGNGNMYYTKTGQKCLYIPLDDGYKLVDYKYNLLCEHHREAKK